MKVEVKRLYKKAEYTIGKLYIDDKYFCDTLEDTDRGLRNNMSVSDITKKKVYGKTAIPTGTYDLLWTFSPKYKKYMPLIDQVKGFSGIRIHSGNTCLDSLGCILLGINKLRGKVLESRVTCDRFYKIIEPACKKGKVTITIS